VSVELVSVALAPATIVFAISPVPTTFVVTSSSARGLDSVMGLVPYAVGAAGLPLSPNTTLALAAATAGCIRRCPTPEDHGECFSQSCSSRPRAHRSVGSRDIHGASGGSRDGRVRPQADGIPT